MKRATSNLIYVGIALAYPAVPASAANKAAIASQEAKNLCLLPGDIGSSSFLSAGVRANASLPRIEKLFADAGISISLKESKQAYTNVLQKDLERDRASYRACVVSVFNTIMASVRVVDTNSRKHQISAKRGRVDKAEKIRDQVDGPQRRPESSPVQGNVIINGDCNAVGNQNILQCGPKIKETHYQVTEQIRALCLQQMPDKSRFVDYNSVGVSSEDQAIGEEFYKYLIERGYNNISRSMTIYSISFPGMPPPRPFACWDDGKKYHVEIQPTIREEK